MAKKKFYEGEIPFDQKGNLLSYPQGEVTWLNNYEIYLELEISRIERGRSAAHFILTATDGRDLEFPMFMKDVLEMAKQTSILGAQVKGVFTFCKRGTNYGLVYVRKEWK